MKIEEAIVFVLASSNHGMKTEQIAKVINGKGLFTRWEMIYLKYILKVEE